MDDWPEIANPDWWNLSRDDVYAVALLEYDARVEASKLASKSVFSSNPLDALASARNLWLNNEERMASWVADELAVQNGQPVDRQTAGAKEAVPGNTAREQQMAEFASWLTLQMTTPPRVQGKQIAQGIGASESYISALRNGKSLPRALTVTGIATVIAEKKSLEGKDRAEFLANTPGFPQELL